MLNIAYTQQNKTTTTTFGFSNEKEMRKWFEVIEKAVESPKGSFNMSLYDFKAAIGVEINKKNPHEQLAQTVVPETYIP
eukprot:Pgem_evm1s4125